MKKGMIFQKVNTVLFKTNYFLKNYIQFEWSDLKNL